MSPPGSQRTSHTEPMTASTTVTGPGRSGPEIRAALAEHAPAELVALEDDFNAALDDAAASFDTRPLEQVLTRWWRIATARSIQTDRG